MRKWVLVGAAAALAATGIGCNYLGARNELNVGMQEFTATHYSEAVKHFQTAVDKDPSFVAARNYLAVAYMQQYIPGSDTPDNNRMAQAAMDNFRKVLESEPKNTVAIASIASLYLNQKKWDEAQQWYDKMVAVDPNNADAYYSMGFIAWSRWYPVYGTTIADLKLKPEDPGPIKDKKLKEELKAKYGAIIDSGIAALDKTLQINPEYEDAMTYENLLIRERAVLADTREEYDKQVKIADGWMDKALATKKIKAERKNKSTGGIVVDTK